MHDELTEDYRSMIYAPTKADIEKYGKAFLSKWRLKCKAVAGRRGRGFHSLLSK